MRTIKTVLSQNGFSALEVTITTAIIAGLTAIGVGSLQSQVSVAKRNEAKANLSMLFAAEKNFYVEFKTYYTNLQVVGYNPVGRQTYNVGFEAASGDHPNATDLATINGYGNPKNLATFSADVMMSTADICNPQLVPNTPCSMSNYGGDIANSGSPIPVTADRRGFTAAAVSTHTQGNFDSMSINDTGLMRVERDGVQPYQGYAVNYPPTTTGGGSGGGWGGTTTTVQTTRTTLPGSDIPRTTLPVN